MLMIDRVLELGENYVRAEKLVSASEPALQGHFPGRPIFPGVLIIEAMAQAAAWGVAGRSGGGGGGVVRRPRGVVSGHTEGGRETQISRSAARGGARREEK